MPFERLMEYAAGLTEADSQLSLGELAGRVGEDPWRLADAVTAVRVLGGERTYVSLEIRAEEEPVVRRALARDCGTTVSGCSG